MRNRRSGELDAGLAVLLALVGCTEVLTGLRLGGIGSAGPQGLGATVAVLAGTVPIAGRRRLPVPSAVAVAVAVAGQALVLHQVSLVAGLLPLLLAVYSLVVHGGRFRLFGPVLGAVVVVAFAVGIPEERDAGEQVFGLFAVLAASGAGVLVGRRERLVEGAARALDRAERKSEAATARALAEERAAIARELHDVIAHGVSVMGVIAGGARVLVETDPVRAVAALRTIESQARESVDELQRLLGVLRATDPEPDRTPQPGLVQVEALVDQMRAAGLTVELTVEGERRPLPVGVDLAAFRIVQEALTNVLKHVGAVPAAVRLQYEPDAVSVRVSNPASVVAIARVGHGLLGMRERVGLYGGSLQAGPGPRGHFTVAARIPVPVPA